jgi:hypothetical protein
MKTFSIDHRPRLQATLEFERCSIYQPDWTILTYLAIVYVHTLVSVWKYVYRSIANFWATFFHGASYVCANCDKKTFWVTFSQTHLVTLPVNPLNLSNTLCLNVSFFKKKSFPPQWDVLFPSSHYNYNYKLQFFDFQCWWLSSSSPE